MSCQKFAQQVPVYGKYAYGKSLSPAERAKKERYLNLRRAPRADGCNARHAANIRTKGAHDFYNMMWDPTIYRGRCTSPFLQAELARSQKKRKEDSWLVKRRRYPRNNFGGIERPSVGSEYKEKVRLEDMGMQTDKYLEEITRGSSNRDGHTQTEVNEKLKNPFGTTNQHIKPTMLGDSRICQTDPSLVAPFRHGARPVEKTLCTKLIEQSLIETRQETELEEIYKKKRWFVQRRAEELYKLKRLLQAQKAVAEKRALALANQELEAFAEADAENRVAAAIFSSSFVSKLVPVTFSMLNMDGFIRNSGPKDMLEVLTPWLNTEVAKQCLRSKKISRAILDDLLNTVTDKREVGTKALEKMGRENANGYPLKTASLAAAQGSMPFEVQPYPF